MRRSVLSPFRLRSTARWLIATGLAGTAQVLRLASEATGTVAKQLRVSMPPSDEEAEKDADRAATEHVAGGAPHDEDATSVPLASAPEPSSPPPRDAAARRRGPLSAPLTEPVTPQGTAPAPAGERAGGPALTEPTPPPAEAPAPDEDLPQGESAPTSDTSGDEQLQTPTEPVPDVPQRSRKPDSDIIDLASKPARTVIAEVASLSTEELRWLHEYEQAHKNRKTVLEAIAQAGSEHSG